MHDNFLRQLLTSTKDKEIIPLSIQQERSLIRIARSARDPFAEGAQRKLMLQYGPILRATLINYKLRLERGGYQVESDEELIGLIVEHFLELVHNLDVERYILFNKVGFYLKKALDDDFGGRRPVKIPGHVVDNAQRVRKLVIAGAALTPELLRKNRLTMEGYNDYIAAFEATFDIDALLEPVGAEWDDYNENGGDIPQLASFDQYEKKENEITTQSALAQLSYEERLIVATTFGLLEEEIRTEVEIAHLLGWTRHQVRTERAKAIRKMRRFLGVKVLSD